MTLIDFNAYRNTRSAAPAKFASLDAVKLLTLRFLECNSQHICGVICPVAAQELYNGFIVDFLADLPEMSLSERGEFIDETIAVIQAIQRGEIPLVGLSSLNAHVLPRLIDRLRMELPPIADFSARMLRTVTTRHGTPHKLDEFIIFSRSARYNGAHWAAIASLATEKGGHSLAIAAKLKRAIADLAGDAPGPNSSAALRRIASA